MTCMGGGKGKKDEQLIFQNMLEYETDRLLKKKLNSLFCKINNNRYKTNDYRCRTCSLALN